MALPPAARAAGTTPSTGYRTDHGYRYGVDRYGGSGRRSRGGRRLDALTDAAARAALDGVRLTGAGRAGGADAAVRAWLRALTGQQRSFTAVPEALATLAAELRTGSAMRPGESGPGLFPTG